VASDRDPFSSSASLSAPPADAAAATFKAPSAVTGEVEANADRRSGARPIINGWRTVNDHDIVVISVGQTRRRLRAGALWRIRLAMSCEGVWRNIADTSNQADQ
jgi:hypothetical protein